jgi:hypothetical protein
LSPRQCWRWSAGGACREPICSLIIRANDRGSGDLPNAGSITIGYLLHHSSGHGGHIWLGHDSDLVRETSDFITGAA